MPQTTLIREGKTEKNAGIAGAKRPMKVAASKPAVSRAQEKSTRQNAAEGRATSKRLRQGVEQWPIQILVPEETRDALRQRSEDTGASIRHIILRSLAADGIPVPKGNKVRG